MRRLSGRSRPSQRGQQLGHRRRRERARYAPAARAGAAAGDQREALRALGDAARESASRHCEPAWDFHRLVGRVIRHHSVEARRGASGACPGCRRRRAAPARRRGSRRNRARAPPRSRSSTILRGRRQLAALGVRCAGASGSSSHGSSATSGSSARGVELAAQRRHVGVELAGERHAAFGAALPLRQRDRGMRLLDLVAWRTAARLKRMKSEASALSSSELRSPGPRRRAHRIGERIEVRTFQGLHDSPRPMSIIGRSPRGCGAGFGSGPALGPRHASAPTTATRSNFRPARRGRRGSPARARLPQ